MIIFDRDMKESKLLTVVSCEEGGADYSAETGAEDSL